jgi:hypothetical protein
MEGPSFKIVYQDLTWNLNAAVYIQKKWRVGLSSLQVFEKNNTDDWENFFMAGPMIQYDIWPASKSPIVLETGVYYGNFAPVTGDLLKRDHTYFFNLGFSGEISLGKQWYLDIGGNFYPVLGQIKGKENFILYNIGINYFLGRR